MTDVVVPQGVEITVLGTVQGVGFRPFIYRLAQKHSLTGSIFNSDQGVVITIEGGIEAVKRFLETLEHNPPPLARINSIIPKVYTPLQGFSTFRIEKSIASRKSRAIIPADIATCKDCLADIVDPKNRRFHYPFTNCTNCGPRYSIVSTIPYDRPGTSMKCFPLCSDCKQEYEDPANRRFHAQPNACEKCGPTLSYHDNQGNPLKVKNILQSVAQDLKQGKIVAMRGLGGFHLVVDGYSEHAVQRLRERKGRNYKPLAVMSATLQEVRSFCSIAKGDKQLLLGSVHPIVLLPIANTRLAPSISPNIAEIGVMLPYTPLHYLLFEEDGCPQTLVMTSGNRSGAPIFTANDAAHKGLQSIADTFLLHNREIVTRVDDSVVRNTTRGIQVLRRSRGYIPSATPLPKLLPPTLAYGAHLKSTFCLTRGREAFLSQHIGDLFNLESFDFYKESIAHFATLLQVDPQIAVCDLHPDYLSSQYAAKSGLPLYRVQHHHAHAAAVLVEHQIEEKVLALILDGSGLGDDNTLWGGEILEADLCQYSRLASLAPMVLPGGDAAATTPWRMALSLCHLANIPPDTVNMPGIEPTTINTVWQMIQRNINCPISTSCGRLFDGVAALLGINLQMDYEGQAAMELETEAKEALKTLSLSEQLASFSIQPEIQKSEGRLVLQSDKIVTHIVTLLQHGAERAQIALDFHLWLITGFYELISRLAHRTGLQTVVLSGGCMQNTLLQNGLFILFTQAGYKVYTGEQIPVNDGGIALGQAVIGGLSHVSGSTNEDP